MSTAKRNRDRDRVGQSYSSGTCPSGKRCHQTRRSAKAHSARLRGDHLREYLCQNCGFWHVGHLPRVVMIGSSTAAEIYGREATSQGAPLWRGR